MNTLWKVLDESCGREKEEREKVEEGMKEKECLGVEEDDRVRPGRKEEGEGKGELCAVREGSHCKTKYDGELRTLQQ